MTPSPQDPRSFRYSIVIPVYNSAGIVGTTVDRVVEVFTEAGLDHEVVLVNDGSPDDSWPVIAEKARTVPGVVAIDLLRNYGQHHANLAGFREATGDYVITMDDDLQNPPEEALKLIDKAMAGHDVVFGQLESKQAAGYRRLGSRMIDQLNRRVFGQPPWLSVSNYRIIHRDVVDRIVASRTANPYITGQALMFCHRPAHTPVRHDRRTVGSSNYNLLRILRLVLTILFSYSSWPLQATAVAGFAFAGLSFLIGGIYLVVGLVGETRVEGWTSLVVLLSVFNGVIIAILAMLGEYVVRTLNAVSAHQVHHVAERVPER